jgi:flagellum-specific ATP synthase
VVAAPSQLPGANAGGNFVQVSRLGMPLVNEAVIPLGKKDLWNASVPSNDAQFLGFVTDPWGRCENTIAARAVRVDQDPVPLDDRARVSRFMRTGVAAVDAFASLGYGQRVALLAGAGVGKTKLLERIVDSAHVDARVLALVGERGREAAELIAQLRAGVEWKSTTVVCATAAAPAVERLAAARTATAQAETLAATGKDVLLVVDSLTRVAAAWRELALAGGEPAAHRGHPPSMSRVLARLVERAGARRRGSVTGIYAVLVEGDDFREPVTDAVRALLDGHITLSRTLAQAGRFPAVDVLRSLSRLMPEVALPEHCRDAAEVRQAIASLERAEDLLAVGAYRPGHDARLDAALAVRDRIAGLIFDDSTGEPARDAIGTLASLAACLRDRG